jgi:hypothetical protein
MSAFRFDEANAVQQRIAAAEGARRLPARIAPAQPPPAAAVIAGPAFDARRRRALRLRLSRKR